MYAQPVLEDSGAPGLSWPGRTRCLTARGRTEAAWGRVPRQRCYLNEDGRLRNANVHDPRLRYPHTYTRDDIAIALAAAED